MDKSNPTVLIVEDDNLTREMHQLQLELDGFRVCVAENGKEAITILEHKVGEIDAVLSDIVMPEMDGYQLCQWIKNNATFQEIPFIFVSTLTTLEEKMKGLSFGADDYAMKPLEAKEVKLKLMRLIELREKNKALNSEIAESRNAAMQIMNFYSDLGQVLEFYKSSINAKSFEELASLFFETMANYGLRSSIQFHVAGDEVLNFGDQGEISPLEANVIEMARKKGRFLSFGSRLVINYQDFSLLVKNMPVENEERTGVLRDSLGVLCNAVEAKVSSLISDRIDSRKNQITHAVKDVVAETQKTFDYIKNANISSVRQLGEDIDNSFVTLGLSEEQEDSIRDIVEACMEKVNEAFEKSEELKDMLLEVDRHLTLMLNIQK